MSKEEIKNQIQENIKRLQSQIDSGEHNTSYVKNCKRSIKHYEAQLLADYLN